MKVLKSHRDHYFIRWNMDDWAHEENLSKLTRFDYVPIELMQRGDITPESQAWLYQNKEQNRKLQEQLNVTITKDGMTSPLILVSTRNPHWKSYVGKNFWLSIPYVIQTGNNRYQYALSNEYTHISSIILGVTVAPPVWNYLQLELKRPRGENIRVEKEYMRNYIGERL